MSKARILVVEDEGLIAEDIRMSLSDLGYDVVAVVSSGEDAIHKAEEIRPDLILMDVILKGRMDGIDAANHITENFRIPVVYLTSYADNGILSRAKITQPFGYLIKPFRSRELFSTIEMALFKHELDLKLRENQEWLSVTLESVADGLIATDPDYVVRTLNSAALEILGSSIEDCVDKPLLDIFKITDMDSGNPITDPSILLTYEDNGNPPHLFRFNTKEDSQAVIELNASHIRDLDEGNLGLVLVFRDITEKRRAEEKIRLLSEAVAQSSEGIAILNMEERILFVNQAFASMHGYSAVDLIGKHYSNFHNQEQLAQVRGALNQLSNGGNFSGEVWHAHQDGSVFPGLMHVSLLRDDKTMPIGIIATLRDITDIKASQEALRSSHRELELYSSSLEHMVEERTRDLENSRAELKKYSESLEKTNEALKIIIEGIEEQKKELEKKLSQNLNLTVRPILDQLKSQNLAETAHFLIRSLEFNLNNIFSSFGVNIIKDGHLLTPREIRICEMIRSGLSSKQIAKVMGISPQTVLVHRKNIRKKLALGNSGQNLASFLKANL